MSNADVVMMDTGMPVARLTPERRREMTREALVEAAADVFARRGFHGASLDEIAESAGFTRGAIYSNFGGKEDLILAVLDLAISRQLQAFGDAMEETSDQSDVEVAAAAARVWTRTVLEDPRLALLTLELRLYAMRNPDFRRRLAEAERRQTDRIAEFIEAQSARLKHRLRIPPRELAEVLNAASIGLSQIAAIDQERGDYYDRVSQLFLGFIAEYIAEPEEKPQPKMR